MNRSESPGFNKQKRKKPKFCCISRKKFAKNDVQLLNNNLDIKPIKSIILTKKKTFHILTSFGSDFELSVSKSAVQINSPGKNIEVKYTDFPPCEDIPGHFVTYSDDSIITQQLEVSPLFNMQGNSDTMSDISSVTLKDILDQCDSSSTGSPTYPGQTLYDLISLRYMPPRNRMSNYSMSPQHNQNEFENVDFEEKVKIQPNSAKYYYKEKALKKRQENSQLHHRIYEIIESITLEPIGTGITSLSSSSTLRGQPRSDTVERGRAESDTISGLPPRMPLLSSVQPQSPIYKQSNSPSILCSMYNLPKTFVSQDSQGFVPNTFSAGNDNEEIYQDIDRDFLRQNNSDIPHLTAARSMRHPPSTLCQNINKGNLKRSSSAEISPFANLPTKRSGSNVSLTKILNYNGVMMQVEPSFHQQSELRHEF